MLGSLLRRLDFLTGHSWSLAGRTLPGLLKALFLPWVTICSGLLMTKGFPGTQAYKFQNQENIEQAQELVNLYASL